jgi:hypothetical protein
LKVCVVPPSGGGTRPFSEKRCRVLAATPSTCGRSAALLTPAAASALRVRAAAMLSVGLSASASSISASSCASWNAFHQSLSGQAALDTRAPASVRCVASASAWRGAACGVTPSMLAHPARSALAVTASAATAMRAFMNRSFVARRGKLRTGTRSVAQAIDA